MKRVFKRCLTFFVSSVLTLSSFFAGTVSAEEEVFDSENVVLSFGVLSDIHISGSWNKTASQGKLDKAYRAFLALAGRDGGGNTLLDAVFIDGDITDAMCSSGNVSDSEHKLYQNYLELSGFRDVTLNNFNSQNKSDNVAIIYANGNHDSKNGRALDEKGQIDNTGFYSPKLMQKILSGYEWSPSVPDNASATKEEVAQYNKELIKAFDEASGKNYRFFYGHDEYKGANGLDYGNRHAVINGYHFITVEPVNYSAGSTGAEFSDETVAWLDSTLSQITSAEPEKAVFVATHARIRNTIFSSTGSATTELNAVLDKYPQVIIWGGHEHSALNRELAIWQGGFTAVDAGVLQYASAEHFGYEDGSVPKNATGLGGYSGNEYRAFSQGQFVQVDADGNVKISCVDFHNSDIENGDIKIIGKPWVIPAPDASGSHLGTLSVETRAANNMAPVFANDASLSVVVNETDKSVDFSFPAATDDTRVISYFLTLRDKNGNVKSSTELTSFYYENADAGVLDSKTYSYTLTDVPANQEFTASVYGIDDFGATTAELTAKFTVVSDQAAAYPAKEFNLANLNKNGWSSNSQGSLVHGVTYNGRTASEIKKDSSNTKNPLIMNNWSVLFNELDKYPYIVIDYYYEHDENSAFSPAPQMRLRLWGKNNSMVYYPVADLETNKWATVAISLKDKMSLLANDDYSIKQYKFDPWGTTALTGIDDNDKLYISGIRFVHDEPEVFTENGKAYVSADSYIKGVSSKVYPTVAEGMASLGTSGGTLFVEGDIIADEGTHIEESGPAREAVTVCGFGKTLSEQQSNRIWLRSTNVGRDIPYNGETVYDKITLKAPKDEAGLFSRGKKLVLGKDLAIEKTVKNTTDIDATGTKSMAFNTGTTNAIHGTNIIEVRGGEIRDVATVYLWSNYSGVVNASASSRFTFYGGNVENVMSGPRNSSSAVIAVQGDVTYDFYNGTFGNVYTGSYKYGTVKGNVVYNVYGGNFENGIEFGNMYPSDGKSTVGNTCVIINSKGRDGYTIASPVKLHSDAGKLVAKLDDTVKFVAVINNAELGAAYFDESLVADHKVRVFEGSAQPVFEGSVFKGVSLVSDKEGFVPFDGKNILVPDENGIYTLSGGTTDIVFTNSLGADTVYDRDADSFRNAFVFTGVQIRMRNGDDGKQGLRYICRLGKDVLARYTGLSPENISPASSNDTGIGFGFVVLPRDILGDGILEKQSHRAKIAPAVRLFSETEDYIEFTVCLIGISVADYDRVYEAVPYITYKNQSGETVTLYGEQYGTSIRAVAQNIYKDANADETLKNYVKTEIIDKN